MPARFGGDGLGAAVNVVIREFPGGYDDASYTFGSYGQHQVSTLLLRRPFIVFFAPCSPRAAIATSWSGHLHTFVLTLENVTNAVYRKHLNRVKDILPEPGRNVRLLHKVYF